MTTRLYVVAGFALGFALSGCGEGDHLAGPLPPAGSAATPTHTSKGPLQTGEAPVRGGGILADAPRTPMQDAGAPAVAGGDPDPVGVTGMTSGTGAEGAPITVTAPEGMAAPPVEAGAAAGGAVDSVGDRIGVGSAARGMGPGAPAADTAGR